MNIQRITNPGKNLPINYRRNQVKTHLGPRKPPDVLDDDMILSNPIMSNPVMDYYGNIKDQDISHRYVKERRSIVNINSIKREQYTKTYIPRDKETNLYSREVTDLNGNKKIQIYNADILNNEYPLSNLTSPPRPFSTDTENNIFRYDYFYRTPTEYEILLPRIFTNVKSMRLLNIEVPNTLNSINEYNNLIYLKIEYFDGESYIPTVLDLNKTPFGSLWVELTPGNYNLTELLQHIEEKINEHIRELTLLPNINTDIFEVTVNQLTGKISFKIADGYRFHLKFILVDVSDEEPITQFNNLWYLLGFSLPSEVDQYGDDIYVQERTNLFNFGDNTVAKKKMLESGTTLSNYYATQRPGMIYNYQNIRPFRFPNVLPHKYIYMIIEGFGTIFDDATKSEFINFPVDLQDNIFAKIVLNVPPGETTTEFVSTTKLFTTTLDRLTSLKIKWVDYAGNPVDFQFRNHSFTVEIIEYIDELEGTNYNSRRGIIDKTTYPNGIKYGSH